MNAAQQTIVDRFHDLYYNGREGEGPIYHRTHWMNVPCLKCPLDLWIYQEIIAELKPDLIVETGTHMGGSALFLAHMLDIVGHGRIVSIDLLHREGRPVHPRVRYVTGSSSDPEVIRSSLAESAARERRLVILDSDHSKRHVLAELKLLAPYVTPGSYVIVEDSNVNGHPTYPSFGEGPYEAVEEFLRHNRQFVVDETKEKFMMTFNPRGFLKRVA